jgi:hypothetical protein
VVSANEVLVQVTGLKKHFPITRGVFRRKVGDFYNSPIISAP